MTVRFIFQIVLSTPQKHRMTPARSQKDTIENR